MQDAPATEAPGPCGGTLLLGVASCHGPAELSVGELVLTLCLPSRLSICLQRPCWFWKSMHRHRRCYILYICPHASAGLPYPYTYIYVYLYVCMLYIVEANFCCCVAMLPQVRHLSNKRPQQSCTSPLLWWRSHFDKSVAPLEQTTPANLYRPTLAVAYIKLTQKFLLGPTLRIQAMSLMWQHHREILCWDLPFEDKPCVWCGKTTEKFWRQARCLMSQHRREISYGNTTEKLVLGATIPRQAMCLMWPHLWEIAVGTNPSKTSRGFHVTTPQRIFCAWRGKQNPPAPVLSTNCIGFTQRLT